MSATTSTASQFRKLRERIGLSHEQVAQQVGISTPSVWDIEGHEDELSDCYSLLELQKIAQTLGVRPIELFGSEISNDPVSAYELVRLIHEQCRLRGITLVEFEDIVGWRLSSDIDTPERLFGGITTEGLRWLCAELDLDWRRVISSL